MHDVFFYEAFAEEEATLRKLLPPGIDAGYADPTIQEIGHKAPPARLISTRNQSRVPLEWRDALDGILTRSTGYDHLLEFAALPQPAPKLGYLPLYCHRAVAEQALMMWMALLRKLPQQMRQFHTFHRDGLTGLECQGRTLLVVGVGNIGREICQIGRGLGMRVLGVDLDPRDPTVEFVSIDDGLSQADVVVCAMDLNASNHNYFHADRLRKVKVGAVFVNISRGELSPSTVLLGTLRSGQLGGVGLDVYDREPVLALALRGSKLSDDAEVCAAIELAKMENVICAPHNAFNSAEAVQRKSEHSIRQIVAFLKTGQFEWPVPV